MSLAAMFTELLALEQEFVAAAADEDAGPGIAVRPYEWRPSGYPELPAIWNWIDDGGYEIDDTARATDLVVITVTIGVRPADLDEVMGRLVTLTDVATGVIDPALWSNRPLGGTAKSAKRLRMATRIDEFLVNDREAPVMCMDLPIQVQLSRFIGGA